MFRGDFEISFGIRKDEKETTSAFLYMEKVCYYFLKESELGLEIKNRNKQSRNVPFPVGFCYTRIMWSK